jgi:cell division protease FtsH
MSTTIGPIAVLPEESQGMFLPGMSEVSQETQRVVDEEVHTLVENAHQEVTRLLEDHRDQLEGLAQALVQAEMLDALDAYAAAGCPTTTPQPAKVS